MTRMGLPLVALVWLLATLLLQIMPVLPDPVWLYCWPLCLLLLFFPMTRLPGLAGLGFLWALCCAQQYFAQVLPENLAGDEIWVTGEVLDIPQQQSVALRFDFSVDSGALPSRKLRLAWYTGKQNPPHWPRAGEHWRLLVKLKPPHGSSNPGGFDYEMWLYQRAIHATGYVRDADNNQRLAAASIWSVAALRQTIAEKILSHDRPYSGLLAALAVGASGAMNSVHWDDLLNTGTNHLMSISGLHVSMVAGLVYWLVLRLLPLAVMRRYAAPPLAAVAGLIAAAVYAVLAGLAIPTQRSLVMLAVVMVAILLRRPWQPMNILAAALMAVLLLDPLAVLAPGFWFSFMAVAIIAYGNAGRIGRGNLWWRYGRIHTLIALALFPLSVFLFQQGSVISPLANFFLVPWVSLIVVPLTLFGCLFLTVSGSLAQTIFNLADGCLQVVWPALHLLAQWPAATWVQAAPSLGNLLLASCGVLLLLAPRGLTLHWLGGVMLLPALLTHPALPAPATFRATLIDVGQGLSVLVQTHNHTLLFDTGPRWGDDADAGERIILPMLRHQGITQLNTLIISNGDADHIGGAASLLEMMPVDSVFGQDLASLQHNNKAGCKTGQHWQWDGVEFYMLHPDRIDEVNRNNYSCVLKVFTGHESLLIAADIEKKIETRLLATQTNNLRSDVLIVPHHGSSSSSSADFIDAVQPRYALVSAGYRNRFGHPRDDVIQRYLAAGTVVLNTADSGAISLEFDDTPGFAPLLNRQASRHYWNAPITH